MSDTRAFIAMALAIALGEWIYHISTFVIYALYITFNR